MTPEQKSQLDGYCNAPNTEIVSVEYPAGLTIGDETHLNLLKVCSRLTQDGESHYYVDYLYPDGRTYVAKQVHTEATA